MKRLSIACSVAALAALTAGAVEYDVPKDVTQTVTSDITGSTLVKTGEGKLYIDLGQSLSSFAGAITVENGTLGAADPNNFGKPTAITVQNGATLDLSAKDKNNAGYLKNVTLAGYGYANQGAIRRTSGGAQDNLLGGFSLADDTLIYNTTRFGTSGTINFNGHYLEKQGPGGEFLLNNCTYKNMGGIILDGGNNGQLTIQGTGSQFGGDSNTLVIAKSGVLCLWATPAVGKAPPWKIVVTNGLWMATGDTGKGRNGWDGPIEIASGKTLTFNPGNASAEFNIAGPINNGGAITKSANAGTVNILGDYKGGGSINMNGGRICFSGEGKTREFGGVTLANGIGGTIALENAGRIRHPNGNLWIAGPANDKIYTFSVTNTVFDGRLSDTHSSMVNIGSDPGYNGCVIVDAGSVMTNRFEIGKSGYGGMFQRGGDVFWQVVESVKYDSFADNGYGFYGLDAGNLTIDNWVRTAYNSTAARGFLVQRGGTLTQKGQLQLGAKGFAELYVANGLAKISGLIMGVSGYEDEPGGGATLTVGKGGTLDMGRSGMYFQHKNRFTSVVNLNDGGTLYTTRMNAGAVSGVDTYYNFNGGKLCPTQAWGFTDQWGPSTSDPAQATVYEGGVTIDPSRCSVDGDWARIPFAFKKATGMGVKSIELPAADSEFWKCNFFGPTRIAISGKGHAATALVDFDLWTKKPRGVIVTGQGFGYDENTTATVESWDGKKTYPCKVTMFTHEGKGGLTVTGSMGVTFATANTYGGPTRVEEGARAIFEANGAFPEGSPLEMRPGGTIDFVGKSHTIPSVTGAGSVVNGNLTVTQEIGFYVADVKAGKLLNFSNPLTLGSSVKVKALDPENITDEDTTFAIANANGGLAAPNSLVVEGLDPSEWYVVIRGNQLRVTRRRGFALVIW